MAVMKLPERMVFWEITVAKAEDSTWVLSHVVAGFKIEYTMNKPTTASITIMSQNYIEDSFTINQPIEIKMGFDRTALVPMFKGKIKVLPSGSATDMLHYVVEAASDDTALSTVSKNVIHSKMTKTQIIETICKKAGIQSDVFIADALPTTSQYMPIQANKTDYEFLKECAAKWGCEFWFTTSNNITTCYFYDKEVAYEYGNLIRTVNPNDLSAEYILGYRTDSTRNNVAKVAWSFKKPKGGGDGNPIFTGADETGAKEQDRQYTVEYKNERWQIKAKFLKEKRWYDYLRQTFANGVVAGSETTLNYYFEKVTVSSKEHSYKHGGKSTHLIVDLNIGDPWLRPPRTAKLFHGSEDPRAVSSYLPRFLWEKNESSSFLIQKVTTSLTAGKISTRLEMRRA